MNVSLKKSSQHKDKTVKDTPSDGDIQVTNLMEKGKVKESWDSLPPLSVEGIDDLDRYLVAIWEPDSIASEQYRILRTHVLEASKNNGSKVFLVSSAVHGEGKTLTAINLAVSIARGLHETVLLIDADLRKPSVSQMLSLNKDGMGLAEYLTTRGDLANYIIKTSIPKLSIIPAGLSPDNPSELIDSEYMRALVEEVKNRYDDRYIIIDSPPLVPVTDAIILSSLADGIIIVIKALETQRELVDEAINKIENKKKIIGLVLNGCEYTLSKYRYGYYHKYNGTKK